MIAIAAPGMLPGWNFEMRSTFVYVTDVLCLSNLFTARRNAAHCFSYSVLSAGP